MKLFAAILALLMLFLSVQPACSAIKSGTAADNCCIDDLACSNQDDEHHEGDQEQQNDCAACNPFQHCSCCVTGIILPPAARIYQLILFDAACTVLPSPEQPAYYSADLSGFWQPPRHC